MSAPLGDNAQSPDDDRAGTSSASPEPSHAAGTSHLDEMVVHDLLNPMTGVLGQLELIEEQISSELTDNTRERLEQCLASARDLSEMLMDLRCLTQIESGQVPQRPAPVSVQELLQLILNECACTDEQGVEIRTDAQHAALHLPERAGLIRRALSVVIRAAVRLAESPPVVVTAAPVDDSTDQRVRIECRYVGRTLPQPLQDKLLSREIASLQRQHGYRIDRARGFELVHHVLELFQGQMHYASASDGGAFVLTFPQRTPQKVSA